MNEKLSGYDHNHTLQTNPPHLEEEPQNINSNKTQDKQLKQSNQLSLPRQDDCKTIKKQSNAYQAKTNTEPLKILCI